MIIIVVIIIIVIIIYMSLLLSSPFLSLSLSSLLLHRNQYRLRHYFISAIYFPHIFCSLFSFSLLFAVFCLLFSLSSIFRRHECYVRRMRNTSGGKEPHACYCYRPRVPGLPRLAGQLEQHNDQKLNRYKNWPSIDKCPPAAGPGGWGRRHGSWYGCQPQRPGHLASPHSASHLKFLQARWAILTGFSGGGGGSSHQQGATHSPPPPWLLSLLHSSCNIAEGDQLLLQLHQFWRDSTFFPKRRVCRESTRPDSHFLLCSGSWRAKNDFFARQHPRNEERPPPLPSRLNYHRGSTELLKRRPRGLSENHEG